MFLATTGCRRGEALGLAQSDIDFDRGVVAFRRTLLQYKKGTIEGTPKTKAGKRTIALDKATVAALERELRYQRQERELLGDAWTDSGYLFVAEDGRPLDPSYVTLAFAKAVKASGLTRITLHGLRHSFATIALNERHAPIGQVSARLGHRDATVTMAIYQHAIEKQDEVLAADFASAVVPVIED
jgi:integrase